jgi:hypothetical protein
MIPSVDPFWASRITGVVAGRCGKEELRWLGSMIQDTGHKAVPEKNGTLIRPLFSSLRLTYLPFEMPWNRSRYSVN